MKLRFAALLLSLLTSFGVYAQSSDPTSLPKIAVLELELGKGIKNNAIARDDFRTLAAGELVIAPTPGARPSDLIALFSCAEMDAACLKQVAASLKVRFVIFGYLNVAGSGEKLEVSLYDADAGKILSKEESTFLADTRTGDMQKAIRKMLRVDEAASIRKVQKDKPSGDKPEKAGSFKLPVIASVGALTLGATTNVLHRFVFPAVGAEENTITKQENALNQSISVTADVTAIVAGVLWLKAIKKNKPTTEVAAQ